jgi:hypothetical protein
VFRGVIAEIRWRLVVVLMLKVTFMRFGVVGAITLGNLYAIVRRS